MTQQNLESLLDEAECVSFVGHRRHGLTKVRLRGIATNHVLVEVTAVGSTNVAAMREAASKLVMLVASPPRLELRACKACGRNVVWAATKAGKAIPIDHVPGPNGNVELIRDAMGGFFASVLSPQEARERGRPLFQSHFATCEHAEFMRKK